VLPPDSIPSDTTIIEGADFPEEIPIGTEPTSTE